MSEQHVSEERVSGSYCLDDRCREEGPRHLHEPFGNEDALAVEVALRAELTPERAALRLAQIVRLEARIALLERVAEAAAEVENLQNDAALRSAIENQRLRDGETLTISVGGPPSALHQARQRLSAALAALSEHTAAAS